MQQIDLDTQHSWSMGPHGLIGGIGYRNTWDSLERGASLTRFNPETRRDHFFSAFLQDDITVLPRCFTLTLGSKIENNTYAGFDYQPSARALWTPTAETGVWWAVSRATQNPSRLYQDISLDFNVTPQPTPAITGRFIGNPDLDSAVTWSYETGVRSLVSEHVSVDLAAFYNVHICDIAIVSGARFVEPGPPPRAVAPVSFAGALEGASYGAEISTGWSLAGWWIFNAGYSFLRISLHPGDS
jgi:iron complex outermembrane receptor protein